MEIIRHEIIDSTTLESKRLIQQGKRAPFAVLADRQTGGLGRFGRAFHSPIGGMYLTIVLEEKDFMHEFGTGFIAVCLSNIIKKYVKDTVSIKWVNDIYIKAHKVAGILVEKIGTNFIIGIGVNLKQTEEVPNDLKDKIGFLNIEISNYEFAREIINDTVNARLNSEEIIKRYLSCCKIIGTKRDGDGEVVALSHDGSLVVKTDSGHLTRVFA